MGLELDPSTLLSCVFDCLSRPTAARAEVDVWAVKPDSTLTVRGEMAQDACPQLASAPQWGGGVRVDDSTSLFAEQET